MTALGAMLRQARLDKQFGFRDAGREAGIDPILFSQIESGTELAPMESPTLPHFLGIDPGTYEGLARLHNEKSPELKAERTAHFQNLMKARKSIIDTGRKSGSIECPICGKQLAFRVHSNGHVHASCETIGCLSWIE
jgi:hypothetical protein